MRFWRIIPLLLVAVAVFAAGPIAGFDAGRTFEFTVGDTFEVRLERDLSTSAEWSWPSIDTAVVKHTGVKQSTEPKKRVEIHSFKAVGPGTIDLFAELVDPADPANPIARFPITVQVVPKAPPSGQ